MTIYLLRKVSNLSKLVLTLDIMIHQKYKKRKQMLEEIYANNINGLPKLITVFFEYWLFNAPEVVFNVSLQSFLNLIIIFQIVFQPFFRS